MKLPAEAKESGCESLRGAYHISVIDDRDVDYSEYMWMGEEMEEFDRQCIEELLEADFIETCFEEMMEEEDEIYELVEWFCEENEDADPQQVMEDLQRMAFNSNVELQFLQDPTGRLKHPLNPDAPEFFPTSSSVATLTSPTDVPFDR